MIDLYQSRNGKNYRCTYYKRDTSGIRDNDTFIRESAPAGVFYADIVTEKAKNEDTIGGAFRISSNSITIRTNDVVDIEQDDLIVFNAKNWIVVGVREQMIQKNSEFSINSSKITTIEIRSA